MNRCDRSFTPSDAGVGGESGAELLDYGSVVVKEFHEGSVQKWWEILRNVSRHDGPHVHFDRGSNS